MNRTKLPTIADIAAHNERVGHYFFARSSMKHFGQRRSDFRRRLLADGRIVVYSYVYQGKRDGSVHSLAVYNPKTGDVNPCSEYNGEYAEIVGQL